MASTGCGFPAHEQAFMNPSSLENMRALSRVALIEKQTLKQR
jgi:hypothetical protein